MENTQIGRLDEESLLRLYFGDVASSKPLPQKKEVELAARIREGDIRARDQLVQANLRFVINVAKKYQNLGLSFPDLIGEGNLGLITAAERFDGTKGYKFITYAVWWIRQAIIQALAEKRRVVRLPNDRIDLITRMSAAAGNYEARYGFFPEIPEDFLEFLTLRKKEKKESIRKKIQSLLIENQRVLSLDEQPSLHNDSDTTRGEMLDPDQVDAVGSEGQVGNPSFDLERSIFQGIGAEKIEEMLQGLSDREQKIIRLYYGLGGQEPLHLREIGPLVRLTRERVRQVREIALGKLRREWGDVLAEIDTGNVSEN